MFEYKLATLDGYRPVEELNGYAADGWRVIAADLQSMRVLLEREVPAPRPPRGRGRDRD